MSTDDGPLLDMANPSASNIFDAAQRQVKQAFEDVGLTEFSQVTGADAFASTAAYANDDASHLIPRTTRDNTERAIAAELARKLAAEAELAQSTWDARTGPQAAYPQTTSPTHSQMQVQTQATPQSQMQTRTQAKPQAKSAIERQAQMQVDRIARNLGIGSSSTQRMAGSASQTRGAGRGAAKSAAQARPVSRAAASGGAHVAAKAGTSKDAVADVLEGVDVPHGFFFSFASIACAVIAWANAPSIGAGVAAVLAIWLGGRALKASSPFGFLVNIGRFASWIVLIWLAFTLFVIAEPDSPEVVEFNQIAQEVSNFMDDMSSDDWDPLESLDGLENSEGGTSGTFTSKTSEFDSDQAKWCNDSSTVLTGEKYRVGSDIPAGEYRIEAATGDNRASVRRGVHANAQTAD